MQILTLLINVPAPVPVVCVAPCTPKEVLVSGHPCFLLSPTFPWAALPPVRSRSRDQGGDIELTPCPESWLQDPFVDEDVKRQSTARMTVWLTRMRPKSEAAWTTGKLRPQFSLSRSAVIGQYILATAGVLTLPSKQKLILQCYLFQYLLIQKVFKQKVNTHTFLCPDQPLAPNWEILNSVN